MADDGFNLVLDQVIRERKGLQDYALALKGHQVCFVKVNCELAIMEEREILRVDGSLGLARAQYAKMKDLDWNYDLEIDTSQTSLILNFVEKNISPTAFGKLKN